MDTEILRLPEARKPRSRSNYYERIRQGLMTRPVRLGARAVGWPTAEVDTINGAIIAGATNDQIRELVQQLHEQRKNLAPGYRPTSAEVPR